MTNRYVIAPEVAAAIAANAPVVALESTVIAHGLPRPTNLELARELEAIVRQHGATPATIALLDGRIRVGLTAAELERLAFEPAIKVSLRDIGPVLARRAVGATTVAATAFIADRVGVRVFATGGIGGVHRGAATTFDVSNDLPTLARARVMVVCAGAKSILDLPATVEWLETHGVTTLGFKTDEFPAFYTRQSGLRVDDRVDAPGDAATIARLRWGAGVDGAVLVVNPIAPEFEIPRQTIETAITSAIAEADERGVGGRDLTPFLLNALAAATAGRSLAANQALLRANAELAAQIALALGANSG